MNILLKHAAQKRNGDAFAARTGDLQLRQPLANEAFQHRVHTGSLDTDTHVKHITDGRLQPGVTPQTRVATSAPLAQQKLHILFSSDCRCGQQRLQ